MNLNKQLLKKQENESVNYESRFKLKSLIGMDRTCFASVERGKRLNIEKVANGLNVSFFGLFIHL